MNAGLWEQRLGGNFQTNVTFHSPQQVGKLRNMLLSHYHFSGPAGILPENVMKSPMITLDHVFMYSKGPVSRTCQLSLLCNVGTLHPLLRVKARALEAFAWAHNYVRSYLRLLLLFLVKWSSSSDNVCGFLVLCCCCRQHEIDKGSNREKLKGKVCILDASDTCIYKRTKYFSTAWHTHSVEGECTFRSSFQCRPKIASQLLLCVSTLRRSS